MPTYHYQSHIQQQNTGPAFVEGNTPTGHYWLAVVAGQKKEVLLNRLSPLLGSAKAPTAPQIEQTLEQFYDWFREAYQQAKGVECPLPDEQILAGAGLVWVNPQGQATLYSLRSSSLCCLQQDKLQSIEKGYQQRQLQPGDLLIADPSQADITLAVVNAYRQGGYSWEALTTTSYNFPVAVLQVTGPKVNPGPEPPTPVLDEEEASDKPVFPIGRVLVFVTLIGGLLAFGYFYLMPRYGPADPAQVVTDTTRQPEPADSSVVDNTVAIDSVPPHVTDDVLPDNTPDSTSDRPVNISPVTDSQATTKPIPPKKPTQTEHDPADDYLLAARQAAAKAEIERKAGHTRLAEEQYNLAIASYNRFEVLRPDKKATVAKQLASCKAGLAMLKESPTF